MNLQDGILAAASLLMAAGYQINSKDHGWAVMWAVLAALRLVISFVKG